MTNQLDAYIPMDRRQVMAAGRDLPDRTKGAALFADISGFTPLTESLVNALNAKRAAEEITHQLNRIYTTLIVEVHRYGGSVIGFVGDAITCWFDASADSLTDAGLRATACALAMQQVMQPFAKTVLPTGDTVALAIKVAVATGPARRFLIGDPQIQYIDVLAGITLEQMAAAEHEAQKGEVVLAPAAGLLLKDMVTVVDQRGPVGADQHYAVISGLTVSVAETPWPTLPPETLTETEIRPWLLAPVFERLRLDRGEFLAEMRPAVALFLKFKGLDYEGDDAAGQKLDRFVRRVQQVLTRYEGYMLQLTIGDKGSYLYAAFGAPRSHDDDPIRAVATALDLRSLPAELSPPPQPLTIQGVQIGLTQGQMRAGAYGGPIRCTYGVIGDEVNMAARLMSNAAPGQIIISRHMAEVVIGHYLLDYIGLITVKGKAKPVPVFQVIQRQAGPTQQPLDLFHHPLVGRESELTRLEEILTSTAGRGHGQIVRLTGDAGIGKSHLTAEFAERARRSLWQVVIGFCQSTAQAISYYPWQQIFRTLFGLTDEPSKADLSPLTTTDQIEQIHTTLTTIEPEWQVRLPLLGDLLNLPIPDNATTATFEPRLRQEALLALAVALLQHWSHNQPLLLLLEDTHWVDEASQGLVLALARVIRHTPIVLVLVHRPPLDPHHPILPELDHLPGLNALDLGELSPQSAAALATHRLTGPPAPLLLHLIQMQAKGHPFFIEELIEALGQAGYIEQQADGHWALSTSLIDRLQAANALTRNPDGELALDPAASLSTANLGLPDSIHGLVLSRLDRLPESVKLTLKIASVIGRVFEFALLARAYPVETDEETLLGQIEAVEGQEFIHLETPTPHLSYIFKHNITRDVAYGTLLETQQRQLHRTVAETMEALHPDAVEALVYHYQRGQVRPKTLYYLDKAAGKAQQEYANETALTYYNQALALEDRPAWRQSQIELLHILGRREAELAALQHLSATTDAAPFAVAYLWGRYYEALGDYGQARQAVEQALQTARSQNNRLDLIRALAQLGLIARRQGDYDRAGRWYREALAMFDDSQSYPEAEARSLMPTLNGLGVVLRQQGEFEQARQFHERALQLSRTSGNRVQEAQALDNLGTVAYHHQRDFATALTYHQQALAVQRTIGNRAGEGVSLLNLAQATRDQGNYGQAAEYFSQALAIQQAIGNRWEETNVWNDLGILYQELGDLTRAQDCLERGLALAEVLGDEAGQAYLLANLGLVLRDQGHLTAAERKLRAGLAIVQAADQQYGISVFLSYLSTVALAQGALQTAIEQAQAALTLRRELDLRLNTTDDLATLAEAYLASGEISTALGYAKEALTILTECAGEGPEFPHRDYLVCYRVLVQAGRLEQARTVIGTAYRLILSRADRISEPTRRRSFLERVTVNREIVATYQMSENESRIA